MTDTNTEKTALRLEGITVRLGGAMLVSLDAVVSPGEVLTVMGPSGSGKSTLLSYIAGHLDPAFQAEGRAMLGETDLICLPPEKRRAGILFQDPLLFPHLSIGGNLLFAIPAGVGGRGPRRLAAEKALEDIGLAGFFERDPDTLSGGQKARVALQRVLLSQPRLLLLDEPFSNLDAGLRLQMRSLVFDTARAAGLPTLLVTHDAADAQHAGGRIITIGGGL